MLKHKAGNVDVALTYLGADHAVGKARTAFAARSQARKRQAQSRGRIAKAKRLRRVAGMRSTVVFRAGYMPATTYGSEIYGITGAERRGMQRIQMQIHTGRNAWGSTATRLAIRGDDTKASATAPILQYAKEVWRALGQAHGGEGRATPLTELREGYTLAIEAGVRRCNQVRGPMGAAIVAAARIGWR